MDIKTLARRLPFIVVIIFLVVATHYYIALFTPSGQSTVPVLVEFEQGASFAKILNTLNEKGLVRNKTAFLLLARLKGSTKSIHAGEYEFSASMSPATILEKLEKGMVVKHPITIPEGYNVREIAELLEDAGLSRKTLFLAKAYDKRFLSKLGIDASSVEGYLFPDTYYLTKGMSEESIVTQMTARFKEEFTDKMKMRAKEVGLSLGEVVTLASIVEKETGAAIERPRIARVFLNRLKRGIMLQSDPTVIYGIKGFNGNITKKDLLADTPYNTYRRRGLTPGPIANPGLESLRAVLYPEDSQYLYFVSRNDGTHYFSKTLSEHNMAVHRYQIKRQKSKTAETRRR